MPIVRRSLARARAEAQVDPVRLRATSEAEIARQATDDPDTAPIQDDRSPPARKAPSVQAGRCWADWPSIRPTSSAASSASLRKVVILPPHTDSSGAAVVFDSSM